MSAVERGSKNNGNNKGKSKDFPEKEKQKQLQMFNPDQFEARASRSRRKHEGESSHGLCDRLSQTRAASQRQLPTDQDYAASTREYQTDQSSLKSAPAAAGPVLERQKQPHCYADIDRSLHIRPYRQWSVLRSQRRQAAVHCSNKLSGTASPIALYPAGEGCR